MLEQGRDPVTACEALAKLYEHLGDGGVFPQSAVLGCRLLVPKALLPLILGGIGDAAIIEHTGNCSFAVAL